VIGEGDEMRAATLVRLAFTCLLFVIFEGSGICQDVQPVTIAVSSRSLPGTVAQIAKEMGLFEKHGIDAKVISMDNSSVATAALLSGSVQYTTSAGNEVVMAQARGRDVVALNSLYSGFSGVVVLSKPAAGKVRIAATAPVQDRLRALDGLVIAAPSASSSFAAALRPAAEAAGARIKFTYMAQSTMAAALDRGAIDGFIASAPFYAFPALNNTGVIWVNGPKGEFPSAFTPSSAIGLNTLRSFAQAHPILTRKMKEVFVDFSTTVKNDPQAVKAAIGRLFPMDSKTLDFLFESESVSFRAKTPTVGDMEREIRFVKSSGADVPDLEKVDPKKLLYTVN
jgi:ABC-type nitrate/sulfonate/bicarbonate transport system substrate-binding protein